MTRIIIELVKYLSIIFITLYAFISFRVVMMKPGKPRDRRTHIMTALMYLIHGMNFIALYVANEDSKILILYGAQLFMFIGFSALYRISYKKMSLPVFRNMMMLLMLGFIMITRISFELGIRQFAVATVSLGLCLIVPMMIDRFRTLRNFSYAYAAAGILTLVIVLFFGTVHGGAKNWLSLGFVEIQPSEFVKLLFIFFVASVLSKKNDFKHVVIVSLLAIVHVSILVLEKDLGGAFLFSVTYIIMLYSATGKSLYLLCGGAGGVAAAMIAYQLFGHVRVRVAAFIDPFAVIETDGFQVAQSLFAIGTGGFTGMGLTQGLPTNIPVAESDFIFSAISEEMGAIVGICICLICLSCFIMFINISVKFKDPFYKITALGLSTMYMIQVFLNIGGAVKCIPSTGVTLPLVSYGGSSVLSSIIMFSIIQGMYVLHMRREETGSQVAVESAEFIAKTKKFYNRSILSLTYIFSALLFLGVGYYGYFVAVQGKIVINSSYNKRQDLLANYVVRGKVLSSDNQILAQTIELEEGKEARVYPYDKVFSHVVGRVDHGKTGIEQSESFSLLTCDENPVSKLFTTLNGEKNKGNNVVTTLNTKLQKVAYDALGNHRGAVVVMEPSTGKILAMVSKPDYNPNTVNRDWETLSSADNSPLLNRATQGLYAPGSTFKILTALEYVRENPNYEDYEFNCKSEDKFNQVMIHCAGGQKHGKESLKQSFANSCNTSFANLGSTLNMDKFHELCTSMYFNTKLPIDLKTSKSSFVLNGTSDKIDYAQTVIGLGKTQITPLHNAMIAAIVANDGVLMKPYLIDHVETASGAIISRNDPNTIGKIIEPSEAQLLTEYMTEVVQNGTGTKLSGMKVSVAGKTGTAEFETGKEPHAWFVGFAPVENPQIAISVLVESSGSGSKYAVPIAKKIIEAYYSN